MKNFDFSRAQLEEIQGRCIFTDEETEVLQYKLRGWYNADIAEELHVSERTVRRRLKDIERKIRDA